MKKIRVDFVAHSSVVVQVKEGDDMYDKAIELAEQYIQGNPQIETVWEVEGDGVDDAFIEKACEKLEKYMYDNLMFQGRLHRKEVIETFIEGFKNYLKGE